MAIKINGTRRDKLFYPGRSSTSWFAALVMLLLLSLSLSACLLIIIIRRKLKNHSYIRSIKRMIMTMRLKLSRIISVGLSMGVITYVKDAYDQVTARRYLRWLSISDNSLSVAIESWLLEPWMEYSNLDERASNNNSLLLPLSLLINFHTHIRATQTWDG